MFEIITNVALGLLGAVAGLFLLAIAGMVLKLFWVLGRNAFESIFEVRWGPVLMHSGLGFVVSLFASPALGIPLAISAGLISTGIVAFAMHKLESFQLERVREWRENR